MVWHSVSWVPQTCGRSMHLVAVESLVAGLAEEAVVLVHHGHTSDLRLLFSRDLE